MLGSSDDPLDGPAGAPAPPQAVPNTRVGGALGNFARSVVHARRSLNTLSARIGATAETVSTSGSKALTDGREALAKLDDRFAVSERVGSAVETVGANSVKAWADGRSAISALDERLGFSRRMSDADEALGLSRQKTALLERVTSMDLPGGLSERHADPSRGSSASPSGAAENHSLVEEVAKRATELRVRSEAGVQRAWLELNKAVVKAATSANQSRAVISSLDPSALCYYDAARFPGVTGCVALTIDDAPCRQPEAERSLLPEVRELLAEFNAHATFFLCTDYVGGHEADLRALLRDGHEVANHCGADRPYGAESEREFEAALLRSEDICEGLRRGTTSVEQPIRAMPPPSAEACVSHTAETSSNSVVEAGAEIAQACGASETKASAPSEGNPPAQDAVLPPRPVRWFRAPHADTSEDMRRVLKRHGFTNVLCDCFANDTVISDPAFIADALLSLVDTEGGSIVVIHVPERGFREHNLQALRGLLEGLRERQMRVLTVSALTEAARAGGFCTPGE